MPSRNSPTQPKSVIADQVLIYAAGRDRAVRRQSFPPPGHFICAVLPIKFAEAVADFAAPVARNSTMVGRQFAAPGLAPAAAARCRSGEDRNLVPGGLEFAAV